MTGADPSDEVAGADGADGVVAGGVGSEVGSEDLSEVEAVEAVDAEASDEGDVDDEDDLDDEDDDYEDEEDSEDSDPERASGGDPELPEDIDPRELDPEIRSELRTLTGPVNSAVAKRLVASGLLLDEDPAGALAHAMVARRMAPRVASVREAVGLAAYHTGQWAMAVAELRTYHRITGRQTHLAILADCERAQGRPEKAVDLYRAANLDKLEPDEAIELLIVAAGARGDMGQYGAAVAMLQIPDLQDDEAPWAARLRYAYADNLLAAGRTDDARMWFARAADVDDDLVTDAAERVLELDGVVIDDPADPAGEVATGRPAGAASAPGSVASGPAGGAGAPGSAASSAASREAGAPRSAPTAAGASEDTAEVGENRESAGSQAGTHARHIVVFTEPTNGDGTDAPDHDG
jgi:tetratricopeptide (TPR) repeat protein